MRIKKYLNQSKRVSYAAALLLTSVFVQAKDKEKFDGLAEKYKGQHAVYTNINEQLVITVEDGQLQANSYTTMEKLLLTDQALNNYNHDYFYYSDFSDLTSLSGKAYMPVKGKTYKEVDCSGFGGGSANTHSFYDDVHVVAAYYAGLTKNSVTETRYSKWYPDLHMLSFFEFQDGYEELPVANITYEVVAPSFVKMNFVLKGEHTDKIKQTREEKNGIVHYKFTATDMPAFKSFEHVPSALYYMPHVIPYIVSYRLDGASKDSVLTSNMDDLYRYVYNHVRHKDMKLSDALKNTVDSLTQNDHTQHEKAAHIYKWVQKNIHYIAFENGLEGFVPRPADTVLKRKYGDCKDMAAIAIAMCRRAGIDAYFTWVGTDVKPYEHTDVPLYLLFNHMICALKIDNEWIFVDGTHPTLPFGHNRNDIQGKDALIAIDEHNYKLVQIPTESADATVITDSTFVSIDGAKLTGSVKQLRKGYDAWELNAMMMYRKKEQDREKAVKALTERGSNRYEMQKYDIHAVKNSDRDMEVTADFSVDNYVHQVGRQCIVNMNLLRSYDDMDIDIRDRSVGSYYPYKKRNKEVVIMNIPKGYRVKYLPPADKGTVDGIWDYTITYKADKNKVILTKEYVLNALSMSPQRFADNNKVVDKLKQNYKESVVLTTN